MKQFIRWLGKCISGGWRFLTFCRRAAGNIIFIALVVVALALLFANRSYKIPERAALVLSPSGMIVEQQTEFQWGKQLIDDEGPSETLLQDIIDAVDHAADDPRIQAMSLTCASCRAPG
jgi:protease IV